jgi:dipeptidyl aminopeptidase/acylaminoacyl peptidase
MMRNLFAGTGPGGIAVAERSASPIFTIDAHTAPTLIAQGTNDALVPVGQSQKLQQALTAAGVPNQLWIYRGGHEFEGARDRVRDFAEAAITFAKDPPTFLKENHPPPVAP